MSRQPTIGAPRRIFTRRRSRLGALLALAAVLVTGCAQGPGDPGLAEAPKDIQVQWVSADHLVRFAGDEAVMGPRERVLLDAFLAQMSPRPSDRFLIDVARPGEGEDLVRARFDAVMQRIRRIQPGAQGTLLAGGAAGPGSVRLMIGRYVALPPNCPNWSGPGGTNAGNLPHSNFGCANATNLSAMVADPADLLRGRELAPADGTAMAAAIARYRAGLVKDPRPQATTEGSGASE